MTSVTLAADPSAAAPGVPRWLRRAAGPPIRGWMRLDVEGQGHVPLDGPFLVAANHASHLDSVALGAASPRPLLFVGSDHLRGWPVFGPLLPRIGMIPLRRDTADTDALDIVLGHLKAGSPVVIYPEGGRTRDGRVYRPRSGIARLATAAGCPVVPAGVVGTADLWPVHRVPRLRRGRVAVRFGPPLAPPDDHPAARRAFLSGLQDELVRLSGLPRAEGFRPGPEADG